MKFSEFNEAKNKYSEINKLIKSNVDSSAVYFLDDDLNSDDKSVKSIDLNGYVIWYKDASKAGNKRVIKYNFKEEQW